MKKAVDKLKNHCFRPSLTSCHWIFGGNAQTLMCEIKDIFYNKIYGEYLYDKKEVFNFEDGGKILLEYKGNSFVMIDQNKDAGLLKPLLFIVPGLTSTGQVHYIKEMVH
jgi:predicted alpha/beta-fold hydrolase